jgi:hypothetical protein
MESLHVLGEPVAATVLLSWKKTGLVIPSGVETSMMHVKFVRLAVLAVIVIVTLTVPVTVVAAASSASSWTAGVKGRNAPVRGSRYPKIPGLAWLFAACPRAADTAAMSQQRQNNNTLVLLILPPLEIDESGTQGRGRKAFDYPACETTVKENRSPASALSAARVSAAR